MTSRIENSNQSASKVISSSLSRDITASVVVFLVALPLCLGIALASGAPLFSGLLAGIIGGIVVGAVSGSHTSVSGPAAGLAAVVAAQIATLGSFEAFLLAVFVAGLLQIGLGIARAGALSAFFPSSVIKGLLAAIGVLLILKQIPHVLGHDADPEGEMSFLQPDSENTFSEILTVLSGDIHLGAAVIGIASIVLLMFWDRTKPLKNSIIPGPLVVVLVGVLLQFLFGRLGGSWVVDSSHLVQIPVAESIGGVLNFLASPDFSQWANPAIYVAAVTIAIVASLETLLNLGIGDILSVRVAGNVIGSKSLGSIEYSVGVAGVKLVLVLGHTRCGAVTSSVQLLSDNKNIEQVTGCQHLHKIVDEIAPCIDSAGLAHFKELSATERDSFVDEVAKRNVLRTVEEITHRSTAIRQAVSDGKVLVVGAVYDVKSGNIEFLK